MKKINIDSLKPIKKMDTQKRSNRFSELSLQKTAKIAGFMFLFAFIVPTLNWAFVLSKFIVVGDALATAKNISSFWFNFVCTYFHTCINVFTCA